MDSRLFSRESMRAQRAQTMRLSATRIDLGTSAAFRDES
jgi:hypothetical protein